MRKYLMLAAMATVIFSAASLAANRADAMTIGNPVGVLAATADANLVENVVYVCRWRHGRRVCWWRPGPRRYYGYYGYHGPYYRPYWGWRHPYYRRWW